MATDARDAGAAATHARWFSANPSKAWGEKFFLLYSPVWMLAFGLYQRLRLGDGLGDLGNLLFTFAIFAPVWGVPAWLRDERSIGRPWYRSYWFKFNVWILLYAFVGSYFFSEYFFDVMGMVYHYPHLSWSFDSALLGSGKQTVPVIMYLHAHYFFITYHTGGVVVIRRVRTSRWGRHPLAAFLAVLSTALLFAWAELFFTTSPEIADQFRYQDLAWALRFGVWFYACYFVVSFPLVFRLDEAEDENWSLGRTALEALAAGMLTFLLLDLVTRFTGAPWGG